MSEIKMTQEQLEATIAAAVQSALASQSGGDGGRKGRKPKASAEDQGPPPDPADGVDGRGRAYSIESVSKWIALPEGDLSVRHWIRRRGEATTRWVQFDGRPEPEITGELRDYGFSYSRGMRAWYAPERAVGTRQYLAALAPKTPARRKASASKASEATDAS